MNAPEPQSDRIEARERLILESANSFANAVRISKDIDDGHDNMMVFLQEVNRLEYPTSDERPAGVIIGPEPEEISAADVPPLEPGDIKRLQELTNEAVDIERALERLLPGSSREDVQHPVAVLRKSLQDRLWRSLNLLYGSDEEGD